MSFRSLVLPLVFLAVVASDGYRHGAATGRWTPLPPLDGYVERLRAVPTNVGGVDGEDVPLEEADTLARAGIAGHLFRKYTDPRTGRSANVLVVCGRPGPISVHTPDVCYRGAGYEPVGDEAIETIPLADGRTGSCRRLQVRPPGSSGRGQLRVRWAWVCDGGMSAPDNPRLAFAREPALYKVYVIEEVGPERGSGPTADLPSFLPALAEALIVALADPVPVS